jgi:hypothetical protein
MTNLSCFFFGFAVASGLWILLLVALGAWLARDAQSKLGDTARGMVGTANVFDWLDLLRALVGMIWFALWKYPSAKVVTTAKTIKGKVSGALSKKH